MGKKVAKSTKKFAASGRLKKVIKARHSQQKWKKKTQPRKKDAVDENSGSDEEQVQPRDPAAKTYTSSLFLPQKNGLIWFRTKKMSVDDFLSGNFMEGSDEEISGDEVCVRM